MLMVQTNAQLMKSNKFKGPPPVPPRPKQSVVAEALAKTRKAVAESKTNLSKTKTLAKQSQTLATKSRTLERNTPSTSAKQNGLSRVKSFIKDVISDRNSSSDEKKSSGQNSRRSSSDSSSIPTPTYSKKTIDSLNPKPVKTCKQIVRSLSTSNKLDEDGKCKVIKSSSFAEKTFPLRKAPPPPLSPKPKLKPMKPLPLNLNSRVMNKPKHALNISPYSSPLDFKSTPSPSLESSYATVEEFHPTERRLINSISEEVNADPTKTVEAESRFSCDETADKHIFKESKTTEVTEMLISEILASRNKHKDELKIVSNEGKDCVNGTNVNCLSQIEVMKDMNNHEMLIYELQTMRSQSNLPVTLNSNKHADDDCGEKCGNCGPDSKQVDAMSLDSNSKDYNTNNQAYAYILDDDLQSRLRKQFRAISTMSLQGLPPLPKSLSGFANIEPELSEPVDSPSDAKPPTDLNSQLIYLKKEMVSLRQLDLSLLSELWTLSEAMATWRRQLERGTRLRPAPPPPPPPHYLRT